MLRFLSSFLSILVAALCCASQEPPSSSAPPDDTASTSSRVVARRLVRPDYPIEALQHKKQGMVTLRLHITESGSVEGVELLDGDTLFAESSITAAKHWLFAPYMKDGQATKVIVNFIIAYRFYAKKPKAGDLSQTGSNMGKPLIETVAVEEPEREKQPSAFPEFPQDLKRQRVQGDAVLRVSISKDGAVMNIDPVSGDPKFLASSVAAIRQWKYKTFLVDGKPSDIQTLVTVHFFFQ